MARLETELGGSALLYQLKPFQARLGHGPQQEVNEQR